MVPAQPAPSQQRNKEPGRSQSPAAALCGCPAAALGGCALFLQGFGERTEGGANGRCDGLNLKHLLQASAPNSCSPAGDAILRGVRGAFGRWGQLAEVGL